MPTDSRQLVTAALKFASPPRVPRHMWLLPWAERRYSNEIARLREWHPPDITWADDVYEMRIVYHTCGGMMPFLERLAAMKPDALETFTPVGMGGDVDLAEARRRLGDTVCMIGGFDQLHHLDACTSAQTRDEVRRCYEEAGRDGGFILSPSDHFFNAEPELITAFADEARSCVYT